MKIDIYNLDKIVGGTTITSTMINSFTSFIKVVLDVSRGLGSSIRRLSEDSICPIK